MVLENVTPGSGGGFRVLYRTILWILAFLCLIFLFVPMMVLAIVLDYLLSPISDNLAKQIVDPLLELLERGMDPFEKEFL